MSLLDRLRSWWSSVRGDDDASTDSTVADAADPAGGTSADTATGEAAADLPLRCAICGTPAAADADQCSLCRSTQLEPADESSTGAPETDGEQGSHRDDDRAAATDGTTAVRDGSDTDDAATRLSQLRDEGDG